MPVATPARPPQRNESQDTEALIEEARRHARRRRRRGALALVAALAVAGFVFDRGGSTGTGETVGPPPPPGKPAFGSNAPARNGMLTIMAGSTNSQGDGPAGYYGISEIGQRGGAHVFVRCPGRLRWCGEVEGIAWAPDGRHLAFSVTSYGIDNPSNGLHIVDTMTGADHRIRPCRPPECSWAGLAWSSGGTRLVYDTNGILYVVNADGTGRRALDTGTRGSDHSPSWSPDGRWIVYANTTNHSIDLISRDGTTGSLLARDASSPAWSPDGRVIAYRNRCGIALITPAGHNVTPSRSHGCRAIGRPGSPAWSPDGRKIAIGSWHRTFVMNGDGSHLIRLSTPRGITAHEDPRPSWQPVLRSSVHHA